MAVVKVTDVFGFLSNSSTNCHANTFTCDDPYPPCSNPTGFDFEALWTITQNYVKHCTTNGSWLHDAGVGKPLSSIALTNTACEVIAGTGQTDYPRSAVWARLTMWKFPLIQLVATSPRPPLGIMVEIFTVLHLLGDPIGAISDILSKIESCQRRAVYWERKITTNTILPQQHSHFASRDERDKLWKALTIITDSYDEWGDDVGKKARKALKRGLENQISLPSTNLPVSSVGNGQVVVPSTFLEVCLTTGGALAADRATRFLPVIVAELLFIFGFAIAMYRIKSEGQQESTNIYMNVEVHSIAFSALYFWLVSAIVMTSVVGSSQTAEAIPRILGRFRKDLLHANIQIDLPELELGESGLAVRSLRGGIYTWQPMLRNRFTTSRKNADKELHKITQVAGRRKVLREHLLNVWPKLYWAMPTIIVASAIFTGVLMSIEVPPVGWSCRSWGQLYFGFCWLGSYILTFLVHKLVHQEWWFRAMVVKDSFAMFFSVGWIVVTQLGYYNRCECYTRWGSVGLALPEQTDAKNILLQGLRAGSGVYTWILAFGIVSQALIVPMLLLWRYRAASRVYWQKDDGTSNLQIFRGRSGSVPRSDGTLGRFLSTTESANEPSPARSQAAASGEQEERAGLVPDRLQAPMARGESTTRSTSPSDLGIELSERQEHGSTISHPEAVLTPTRRTTSPRQPSEDRTPLLSRQ